MRFQLVEEIVEHLGQRQVVGQVDALRADVFHFPVDAAAALQQFQDVAQELVGGDDDGLDVRLLDLLVVLRVGQLGRRFDLVGLVLARGDAVAHRRGGGDDGKGVFPLQALLDDLLVQQAQEAAAEADAQRRRRLRLVGQGGIVQGELFDGLAQFFVAGALGRVEAGEDHGLGFLEAGQGQDAGFLDQGDRVADLHFGDVLDAGDDVADFAGLQRVQRQWASAC